MPVPVGVLTSLFLAAVTVATTLYAPVTIGQGVDLIVAPGQVDFAGLGKILMQMGLVIVITALSQWLMKPVSTTRSHTGYS